ncbi:DUF308 domain-containing protein [Bifidobacterium sp. ESL0732]|uniref:DUF308 domain-containing protein n=1 Tax=Bifidobacterium sp. ESL0732 TaxID=2983222 RepID=UPI0023F70781|nr:DUF308 domain-containing protein [Bifidobacterium sp. ESL0732]WEV63510.1 DUF308 domain-containing protein [Bifidobacterium sp. ESL0732]
MTSLKDSNNSDDKRDGADSGASSNDASNGNGSGNPSSSDAAAQDEAWKRFEAEHADDLDDISSSRNAKRFEKRAKREEKKALLSVEDITPDSFANGFSASSSSSKPRGPRDFEGSSWLDTDNVIDSFDDFTPPNPDLGHLDPVKVVFWGLLVIGIAGLIAAVFFPRFAGIMGLVFGLSALIGGVGLLTKHKGFHQTQTDYYDDGSRV